ncbi:MAG: ankyrin repeat domain-containing protein, partial [Chloroflexi bacterium]|nr:ankyrin repeat domain-containing protein [Chloroflexota bacterium]
PKKHCCDAFGIRSVLRETTMNDKHPLLLILLIAASLFLACSDAKQFDDPEFWRSATAEDMKSVMDSWRDVDGTDGEFTPLHYAVLHSAPPELVRELLSQGANANARYDNRFSRWNGWTPLHLTTFVQGNHRWIFEVIEPLLSRGADIEARNAEGATPLHLAALYGNAPAAATLLKRGADIHARAGGEEFDNYGHYLGTPLHLAVRQSESLYTDPHPLGETLPDWYPIVLEHKPAVVETLLAHGARTDLEDERGLTPLHRAVEVDIDEDSPHGETKRRVALEVTELLIRHGTDVNATPSEGFRTPLHVATGSDAGFDIAAMLLHHGADAVGEETTWTSLHAAALRNPKNLDMFKLLLENGTAPYVNTCSDALSPRTPFTLVLRDATPEIVELFIEHGASVDAGCELELALKQCGVVGRGSNESMIFKSFPIHHAAGNEDPRVTRLLLELGADPNVKGICYNTPLPGVNRQVAEALLQYGADTEERDIVGETPLLQITQFSHLDDETERIETLEVIETLLDYGAHVDARSNGGHNALHYLAGWPGSDPELVRFFLDRGVNPDERANNGEIPCHIARDNIESEELLELFCQ